MLETYNNALPVTAAAVYYSAKTPRADCNGLTLVESFISLFLSVNSSSTFSSFSCQLEGCRWRCFIPFFLYVCDCVCVCVCVWNFKLELWSEEEEEEENDDDDGDTKLLLRDAGIN